MATHSSILAWKIPWTEEPGRLQSMGSQRVRRNWLHFHFSFLTVTLTDIALLLSASLPIFWVTEMRSREVRQPAHSFSSRKQSPYKLSPNENLINSDCTFLQAKQIQQIATNRRLYIILRCTKDNTWTWSKKKKKKIFPASREKRHKKIKSDHQTYRQWGFTPKKQDNTLINYESSVKADFQVKGPKLYCQ